MHPPPFRLDQRLLDWSDCRLELQCCKGTVLAPVRLLATQHGNLTFGHLLSRLRCGKCRGQPRAVFLCAGQRQTTGGPPPDWAIELVSPGQ
jgi:Uma2 family endonuclease